MSIVAVFNQKGGVGKTTTTLNLAAAFRQRHEEILTIDLDPQSSLSQACGVKVTGQESLFGFYKHQHPLADLVHTLANGAHLIPAHIELSKVDVLFGKGLNSLTLLRDGLRTNMLDQDTSILLDCSPMLGILSLNAIFAAEKVLIPVSADYLSIQGAQQLENTLKALEHVLKKRVVRRYVLTRFDVRRPKLSQDVLGRMQDLFGEEVCQTRIAENTSLTESPAFQKDVFSHAPSSQGAKDYLALWDELRGVDFL